MSTPSLLLVPARLKDGTLFSQIPTNGSGDFTVVQAVGNATRVNASGFVESAKTNLAFHSTDWTSNWNAGTASGTTVITNSAISLAPDGTATANEIYPTSGNTSHLRTSNSTTAVTYVSGTVYTQSAFFKAGIGVGIRVQLNNTALRFSQSGYANFDLIAGTVLVVSGTTADTNRAARIENYGNGWYRCSYTATCTSAGTGVGVIANLIAASGDTRSPSFEGTVTDYLLGWGAQLEVGSSASDYIPTTTVARTKFSGVTVNGTSIANIPRLDYFASGGTVGCPALLVEPSATNSILQSTDSASGWILGNSMTRATIDVIGVSGVNLTVGTSGSIGSTGSRYTSPILSPALNLASGSTYTISFLAKKTTAHTILGYFVTVAGAASGDLGGGFNVSGSFSSGSIYNSAGTTNRIRRVEQWGTDVFRCSETFTMTASGTVERINLGVLTAVNLTTVAPTGTTIGFAAPQIELGSVPTSFIPTTTGSVTRNADVISASGNVSGSIGQTEGSIYAEVNIQKLLGATQRAFVDIGQSGNRLFLGYGNGLTNQIRFLLQTSGGGLVDFQSAATTTGTIRIAVGYKNSDSAMYVNGVKVSPVSNGSFTSTLTSLSNIYLGSSLSGADFLNDRINAVALYATRLSDDALMLLSMQGNDAYLPQAIWNFYEDSRTGNTEVPTCLYERHADIIDV